MNQLSRLHDIKNSQKKKKLPNHVICGYTEIDKNESEENINLPKVVLNSRGELVYISDFHEKFQEKKKKEKKLNILSKYVFMLLVKIS